MPEAAAAGGFAVLVAVLAIALPAPPRPTISALPGWFARLLESERGLAATSGLVWLDAPRLVLLQLLAAALGGISGLELSGLPVLAIVGALGGAAGARLYVHHRAARLARSRQDGVLESVRMLRQLLEAGGLGVQEALSVLAERGPDVLRAEFRSVVAAGVTGRQQGAWAAARGRVGQPLFDLLVAAILVQRPGGGRLGPLFAELEESVSTLHEVVREAEAMQVQARSAALFILALPVLFIAALAALHSPYLNAYRTPAGGAFLGAMLGVMGLSYLWIRQWLKLPEEPRLRVIDG